MSDAGRVRASARGEAGRDRPGGIAARCRLATSVLVAAVLAPATATVCAAQDFSAPDGGGPTPSSLGYLETALPHAASRLGVDASVTRWFGIPDLSTRAIAIDAGWRSLRAATGVSASGDPAIGWSSVALACGAAHRSGGVGVRALARRDRTADSTGFALGPGVGAEAGGGAWVGPRPGLVLWVSAPQLWTRGAAPPLARALELGASFSAAEVQLWCAREAPRRPTDAAGTRRAGIGLDLGPWRTWLEARDRPLRGGAGLLVSTRGIVMAVEVESHPVLGETTRLSIGVGSTRVTP